VFDFNPDGSLRHRVVTQTSANGQTKTIQADDTGSGIFDATVTESIVPNADGSLVTTRMS